MVSFDKFGLSRLDRAIYRSLLRTCKRLHEDNNNQALYLQMILLIPELPRLSYGKLEDVTVEELSRLLPRPLKCFAPLFGSSCFLRGKELRDVVRRAYRKPYSELFLEPFAKKQVLKQLQQPLAEMRKVDENELRREFHQFTEDAGLLAMKELSNQIRMQDCISVTTCYNIRVIVSTFFDKVASTEGNQYAYRIMIQNLGQESVQLVGRHWVFQGGQYNISNNFHDNDYTDTECVWRRNRPIPAAAGAGAGARFSATTSSGKEDEREVEEGKDDSGRTTDYDKNTFVVGKYGRGLVGEMPRLGPGDTFQYVSSCIINRVTTRWKEGESCRAVQSEETSSIRDGLVKGVGGEVPLAQSREPSTVSAETDHCLHGSNKDSENCGVGSDQFSDSSSLGREIRNVTPRLVRMDGAGSMRGTFLAINLSTDASIELPVGLCNLLPIVL